MTRIRQAESGDRVEWLRMRVALYPDHDPQALAGEIDQLLGDSTWAVFVAEAQPKRLCGFVEVSFRPRAEGCESGAVGYVGSWYVDPKVRTQGIGRELLNVAERWACRCGAKEMASDCDIENKVSREAHEKIGYVECGRLVHWRKNIQGSPNQSDAGDGEDVAADAHRCM